MNFQGTLWAFTIIIIIIVAVMIIIVTDGPSHHNYHGTDTPCLKIAIAHLGKWVCSASEVTVVSMISELSETETKYLYL